MTSTSITEMSFALKVPGLEKVEDTNLETKLAGHYLFSSLIQQPDSYVQI
jgi:hypothetical protein